MEQAFKGESIDFEHDKRLGVGPYMKEMAWAIVPTGLVFGAWLFGRATNYKFFPLDGSPSILQWTYEKLGFTAAKKMTGQTVKFRNNEDRWGWLFKVFGAEYKENAAKDLNNVLKTTEVAIIPTLYHYWHQEEENRLDLVTAQDRLHKLPKLAPTDEELSAENASLREQLAFMETPGAAAKLAAVKPETKLHANNIDHKGAVIEAPYLTK